MSTAVTTPATEERPPTDGPATSRAARWRWPLVVVVVTFGYAWVPYLLEQLFYQRGDTAVQFAPTWYHLGDLVRGGAWPPTMDPDVFQGGNYAAEALHGVYNPLNVLVWLLVSLSPDLVLATALVKTTVLAVLALGTYLLAREYGALPWAAAAVAVALPFSGFTLFWDAGSWPSGLIAFAYTPWVWVTFRRCLRGAGDPLWAFLAGVLAVTAGNPYGTLAVVAVGAALLLEGLLTAERRGMVRLVLVGVCVAAFLPLVYLPLLEASELSVRASGALFENSGKMRPELGDLFGFGSPTYVPGMRAINGQMAVPATYFTWFLLPLLPWLRYDVLRRRGRELVGLGVVGVAYLALTVGPSKLWLFRWPIRLVEYGFLAVAVVTAVLLSQGLRRDHVRRRAAATGVLVLLSGYLTWAENPQDVARLLLGLALVAVGAAAVLLVALRRPAATALTAAVLVAGTGVVVTAQVATFGENASSRYWHTPSDVDAMQERFAGYEGRVMQFADLKPLQNQRRYDALERAWDDYLPGSLYQVAGVDAVNSYTGVGLRAFNRRFCMEYDGLTKACGYRELWADRGNGLPPLVDQLKLDTVVVQPRLAEGVRPAPGWEVAERTPRVLVLTRTEERLWPESRLSFAPGDAEVTDAVSEGLHGERVELADTGVGGTTVFAALGWPGWTATLDGEEVPVGRTKTGLLTVDLPPDRSGTLELSYSPPGQRPGLLLAALGTLGALALGLLARRSPGPDAPAGVTRAGGARRSSRRFLRPGRPPGSPGGRRAGPGAPAPPAA